MSNDQKPDKDQKKYPPSDKVKKRAREQGQIPFVPDLVQTAVFGIFILVAFYTAKPFSVFFFHSVYRFWSDAFLNINISSSLINNFILKQILYLVLCLCPLMIVGIFLTFFQTYGQCFKTRLFNIQNLKPQLPFGFSGKKFQTFISTWGKVLILFWVSYVTFQNLFQKGQRILVFPIPLALTEIIVYLGDFFIRIFIILFIGSLILYGWSYWTWYKGLFMTRKEKEEEMKEQEGSPIIRRKQHEKSREILHQVNALQYLDEANVLITNPTHYAVGVQWIQGKSPVLKAKGTDQMVKKMKQRAEFLGIIIIPHPFLARKIFKEIQIHESVPGNFAALFIEVLRYMRKHYPAISLWSSTPQNLSDSNKKT